MEENETRIGFVVEHPEHGTHEYYPTPKQLEFHQCQAPNCILEGSRGTGKSVAIRNDAHMRALAVPGLAYLIIRRTMPELRKTHIRFIQAEMRKLGGFYNKTEGIAYYPNGSVGHFAHCEGEEDVMKLLSSEYGVIYLDEITTFSQDQITKIATCARVPEGCGLIALIRGGTNPIGIGADYVRTYYITKDVDPLEDPDYHPDDYVAIHTILSDNPHIDANQYRKRFSGLPEHVRRAWLDAEWALEGAYFADFRPTVAGPNGDPIEWHVISKLPRVESEILSDVKWLRIYRTVDWGYFPDPACCLWIVILPNGREIVFDEETWFKTIAKDVATEIKEQSDGQRIAETFCDPTMFDGSEATGHSVGDIFEMNGVPLTQSKNSRSAVGFAIHEHLNTLLEDGFPKMVFYKKCKMLIKTLPTLRMDKHDTKKIADGNDHWTIALGYYCMTHTGASMAPNRAVTPKWMVPKPSKKAVLGRYNVRNRR
jgi:hypothetical protein